MHRLQSSAELCTGRGLRAVASTPVFKCWGSIISCAVSAGLTARSLRRLGRVAVRSSPGSCAWAEGHAPWPFNMNSLVL